MHKLGVPAVFLRWIRGFLLNRQACISYNNTLGRTRRIRQGLPQSSVLSPLLFSFYINSVSKCIPKSVNCAMYADDVSLWASNKCKESATADIQQAVNSVRSGAGKRWLSTLRKVRLPSSVLLLHEANWQPTVWLNVRWWHLMARPVCLASIWTALVIQQSYKGHSKSFASRYFRLIKFSKFIHHWNVCFS